jgi:hypothetical protein
MIDNNRNKILLFSILLVAIYILADSYLMGFSVGKTLVFILGVAFFNLNAFIRKLIVAFFPIILFVLIYDFMRVYPNYLVNPIDTEGLYTLEKNLFGIVLEDYTVIPCEYFKVHHWAIADIFSGLFYLCWVPLPIVYGLYLYFTGRRSLCFRFTSAFLVVNLIGFVGYYIHPAAPPWYVMQYGFTPDLSIGGNVAGFANFSELTGVGIFEMLYEKNSNVYAAIPSLHSAYVPVALYYSFRTKPSISWITVLSVVTIGIWISAVYSGHHYIIDVILGIMCSVLGIIVFEYVLMRITIVKNGYKKICAML